MSTHDSGPVDPPADPTADPTAHPTPGPTAEPMAEPTAEPTAEPMAEPTAEPMAEPTAEPTVTATTTQIPSTSTQALPEQSPFRVEPPAPVPDDVVTPGSELPHLPPPAAPQQAPAPQLPPHPVRQPAPRPTIVTVRRGPRPGSVMLGLLTLLVGAYLLVANLTRTDLAFTVSGPSFIGAFGGILLLVGLAGVLAGRLRRR